MPLVTRMAVVTADRETLIEAWSLDRPSEETQEFVVATAERMFDTDGCSLVIDQAMACRTCGCTDDRACAGGCSWVEADLCSSCAPRP